VLYCAWYLVRMAQVLRAEDQHAVQELAAHGADERPQAAFMRCAWTATQDPGAGGLEHGVKCSGEVRFAVAGEDLMSSNRSPKLRERLRACCYPFAGGASGDTAPQMHPAGASTR
jgi:hypothetical protein